MFSAEKDDERQAIFFHATFVQKDLNPNDSPLKVIKRKKDTKKESPKTEEKKQATA